MELTSEEQLVLVRQKRKRQNKDLSVYISEEHNGALESLHRAIRCGEIAFNQLTLLHIDSHPDLMVPPEMSADVVFDPRELHYQLGLSETGIAEFILPACYAGHIENIIWIKNSWSTQLGIGTYDFFIGNIPGDKVKGPLRVSCSAPYFYDEGLFEMEEKMENCRKLRLVVSEEMNKLNLENQLFEKVDWILDICLDYFSVNNPFLVEFEKMAGVQFTQLLVEIYCSPKLHWRLIEETRSVSTEIDISKSLHAKQSEFKDEFDAAIADIFEYVLHDESRDQDEEFILVSRLSGSYTNISNETLVQFLENLIQSDKEVRLLASTTGPLSDLPHNRSSEDAMEVMLLELQNLLVSLVKPKIVTIARSSSDEYDYTPSDQTDWLLKRVLETIRMAYGNLNIEYDQGVTQIEF